MESSGGPENELSANSEAEDKLLEEVEKTSEYLAENERRMWGTVSTSWNVSASIVKKVKPVPWLFWIMIRSVYGKSGEVKDVDPMTFSLVENLLKRALKDPDLCASDQLIENANLTKTVDILGSDLAASLCFVHSVSRRVSVGLNERVFRAIMDDALLRARLGVMLGQEVPLYGIGRCLLAGFAGRSGLAVQLASGSEDQARIALSGLATGKDIGKVCMDVYGCYPLQVAALSLVSGGCSRDIALGISAFSLPSEEIIPGSEQYKWLSIFSVLEHLRLNSMDQIPEDYWKSMGMNENQRKNLEQKTQQIFRKGHGFSWILKPLSEMLTN